MGESLGPVKGCWVEVFGVVYCRLDRASPLLFVRILNNHLVHYIRMILFIVFFRVGDGALRLVLDVRNEFFEYHVEGRFHDMDVIGNPARKGLMNLVKMKFMA